MIVFGLPESYRGYDFIYLGDEVLILDRPTSEVVDTASNYKEAERIIDTWLNAV